MRRLSFVLAAVLALVGCVAPRRSAAQFIGYTSPQGVQQVLASNVACTGALQSFPITNIGQTTHVLQWTNSTGRQQNISLSGSYDGTNFFTFSDSAQSNSGILQATGYYPALRADVICSNATFTLNYSGTSTFALQGNGFAARNDFAKVYGFGLAAASNSTGSIITPSGSSGALLTFQYQAAAMPVGSTVTVTTTNLSGGILTLLSAVVIPNDQNLHSYLLANVPTTQINVTYTAGGASASTYNMEVDFFKPGFEPYSADPCKLIAGQVTNCPVLP